MSHFKCSRCRARTWRDGDPADERLCPGCGHRLEPVARAEELIGLPAFGTRRAGDESLGGLVRDAIARNDAARLRRLRTHGHDERPAPEG